MEGDKGLGGGGGAGNVEYGSSLSVELVLQDHIGNKLRFGEPLLATPSLSDTFS